MSNSSPVQHASSTKCFAGRCFMQLETSCHILMQSHSSCAKTFHVHLRAAANFTKRDRVAAPYSTLCMCSQSHDTVCFTRALLRLQLSSIYRHCKNRDSQKLQFFMWGKIWPTKVHSECRSFMSRERKLHWSKTFLVLHPLRSSKIKTKQKTRQAKPKYSLQRKIENSSFWHENISGAYMWSETVSIHIGQNSPCSQARKSQIKCEATSGLNIAQKQITVLHSPKPDMIGNNNIKQWYLMSSNTLHS